MKKLSCCIAAYMFVLSALAQYTAPQVLGSSGGSGRTSTVSLDWTAGETITETHKTSGLTVTQGFHQGNLRFTKKALSRLPDENAVTTLDIQAFPNPTYDFVTLQFGTDDVQDYSYTVYDITGQELFHGAIGSQAVQADFSPLPKATYLLVVKQLEVPVKVFQILKN